MTSSTPTAPRPSSTTWGRLEKSASGGSSHNFITVKAMSAPALASSTSSSKTTSPTNNAYVEPLITFEEWEERKRFSGFGREDENILRELHLVARTYADEVMEQLYERWLQFPELRSFFTDETTLARVKGLQKQYFIRLTSGEYNMEYLEDRLRIGRTHRHIGLAPRFVIHLVRKWVREVLVRGAHACEYRFVELVVWFGIVTVSFLM